MSEMLARGWDLVMLSLRNPLIPPRNKVNWQEQFVDNTQNDTNDKSKVGG